MTKKKLLKIQLKKIETKMNATEKDFLDFFKRTFPIQYYIEICKLKTLGSTKKTTNESLSTNLMTIFNSNFSSSHPHYEHYKNEVSRLSIQRINKL